MIVSDLHQASCVLALVRTRVHHHRARRRQLRPGHCHTEAELSKPGSELATSAADYTCPGAGLVTDAAEQASDAAEQVCDSLREKARRRRSRVRTG